MGDADEEVVVIDKMVLRPPAAVLWTWQTCDVVLAVCAVSTAFIGLKFMLIPLTMAYMTTYAMGPLMDLLESRPYTCIGGKEMCATKTQWTKMVPVWSVNENGDAREDPSGNKIPLRDDNRNVVLEKTENAGDDTFFQLDEAGNRLKDKYGDDMKIEGCALDGKQLVMLQKLPHVVACLITLLSTVGILATLGWIVGSSFSEFAAVEASKADGTCDGCDGKRQDTINDKLTLMANEFVNQLEDDGVKIVRPRICQSREASGIQVFTDVQDMTTIRSGLFCSYGKSCSDASGTPEVPDCKTVKVNAIRDTLTNATENDIPYYRSAFAAGEQPFGYSADGSGCVVNPTYDSTVTDSVDPNSSPLRCTQSDGTTPGGLASILGAGAAQIAGEYDLRSYDSATLRCAVDFNKMVTRGYGMVMTGATCVSPTLNLATGLDYPAQEGADSFKLDMCITSMVESGDLIQGSQSSPTVRQALGGLFEGVAGAQDPTQCTAIGGDKMLEGNTAMFNTEEVELSNCTSLQHSFTTMLADVPDTDGSLVQAVCDTEVEVAGSTYRLSNLCPMGTCNQATPFTGDNCREYNATDGTSGETITCTGKAGNSTLLSEVCTDQATAELDYYNSILDQFRTAEPPADMTMAIRIYNFAETLNQETGNCTAKNLFATREDLAREKEQGIVRGSTWEEFTGTVSGFMAVMNDVVLVVLLAVYILLERPEGSTLGGGDSRVLSEIEALITDYIVLKTLLSMMTGILTAIMLVACKVQLGVIFGLLAFLLNYIPSVGSMIAMVLPIPIVWLDDNIDMTMKLVAISGPAAVQGYIGNALEPSVFGKSMNMTAIAVLLSLVLFGFVWGLPGAVLSVPILGIIKIVCHHTDHPLANYFLITVREDPLYP